MNPYEPTATPSTRFQPQRRWFRSLVLLNCLLLGIPGAIVLFAYISLHIDVTMQPDKIGGDPVAYTHTEFTGISGPIWRPIAYFLVPNALLISFLLPDPQSTDHDGSKRA